MQPPHPDSLKPHGCRRPGDPRRRRHACASGRARLVGSLAAAECYHVAVGVGARASNAVLCRYTQAATTLVRSPASRSDACAPPLILRACQGPFRRFAGYFYYCIAHQAWGRVTNQGLTLSPGPPRRRDLERASTGEVYHQRSASGVRDGGATLTLPIGTLWTYCGP